MFFHTFTITLFAVAVNAANICTYSAHTCNSTTYSCCSNIASNACCYWGPGTPYGRSTKFSDMPDGPDPSPPATYWTGRTYGDQCTTSTVDGASASSSSSCNAAYNAPSYEPALSAAWFDATSEQAAKGAAKKACVTPDMIGFATKDGTRHEITVPEGQFRSMLKLIMGGKYDDLLAFKRQSEEYLLE